MAKARITYLSETEKEFVHQKTLEVLEKVGVAYNSPKAIELLQSAGARVDREALTARLTWDLIEPALRPSRGRSCSPAATRPGTASSAATG